MQAKASKIVILCYFLSIFCLNNCCKIIQNIKNYLLMSVPPTRGGVWCDTPVSNVRTTPPDVASVHNKYGGSRPREQSLLRYQPDRL